MKRYSTRKKLIVIGVAYVLCVATALSLFLATGAKYLFNINGYTEFTVAEFNGAIFDDVEVGEETAVELLKSEFHSGEIKRLGASESNLLQGCFPGMEARDYPFIVANGTGPSKFATVDINFAIKVRTMLNVPLHYEVIVHDETTDTDTSYSCNTAPSPLENTDLKARADDAVWYEYFFMKEDSAPGTEEEIVFTIPGGKLAYQSFNLRVTWPIEEAEGNKPETNATSYMEEVELIQLIASVTSGNGRVDEVPVDITEGLIIVDPDHSITTYEGEGKPTVYTYDYHADYDAFVRQKDESDNPTQAYRYYFTVNNGNNIFRYDEDGNRVATQQFKNTYYRVRALLPYDDNVKGYTYQLLRTDTGTDEPLIYQSHVIEYRRYEILDGNDDFGTYTVLSKEEADQELARIAALAENPETAKQVPTTMIYCLCYFRDEADGEPVFRLNNDPANTLTKLNTLFSANHFALELTVPGTATITCTNAYEADYRLAFYVDAVTQDSMITPEIPTDYLEWSNAPSDPS